MSIHQSMVKIHSNKTATVKKAKISEDALFDDKNDAKFKEINDALKTVKTSLDFNDIDIQSSTVGFAISTPIANVDKIAVFFTTLVKIQKQLQKNFPGLLIEVGSPGKGGSNDFITIVTIPTKFFE